MNQFPDTGPKTTTATATGISRANSLIRNTYTLLAMTLAFSALTSFIAMAMEIRPFSPLLSLVVMIGLLFGLNRARNSVWAIPLVFLFTGFMGFQLGPILNLYMQLSHGPQLVGSALAYTALSFVGLSAYAGLTRKDFSFLRGFVFTGLLVLIGAVILNLFLQMPMLYVIISAAGVLLACALILYDTSNIIHGGETNYVMATVQLYLDFYMLFVNLLSILGIMRND